MRRIIGLVGYAGSGKNTVGNYLVKKYNYESISFANSLKDTVATLFEWPRDLLEGDTEYSRRWRETEDAYWSNKFQKSVTPRWVLKYFATDVIRNHFHIDLWVWNLEKKISNDKSYVITDVRFKNEINLIKRLNGNIFCINRNNVNVDTHLSENEWVSACQYIEIDNNKDLNHLYKQIDDIIIQ